MKPLTITIYNSKGGVGKTTLVSLLGVYLAAKGRSVAIIDLDQQGSQSLVFDLVDEAGRSLELLHRVIKRELDMTAALMEADLRLIPDLGSEPGALFIAPGGPQTKEAIEDVVANPVRFKVASPLDIVRQPIAQLTGVVDVVLIDMGPSDQVSALAGLVATDALIIPTLMDLWSVERVAAVMEEVAVAQQAQAVRVAGIIPTMTRYYFGRLRKSQAMQAGETYLKANYDELLRDGNGTVDLPYHEDFRKAAWVGETVLTADVSSQAREYALRALKAMTTSVGIEVEA